MPSHVDRQNLPDLLFVRERDRDTSSIHTSSPGQNTLVVPAVLAGHGDAIGALITALAVPIPPVAALAANLTVPRAAILYYAVPAEGIPIACTAFRAKVHAQ